MQAWQILQILVHGRRPGPCFAIGGISEENLDRVLEAWASRVAVSGAVMRSNSPRRVVARLKALFEGVDPGEEDQDS